MQAPEGTTWSELLALEYRGRSYFMADANDITTLVWIENGQRTSISQAEIDAMMKDNLETLKNQIQARRSLKIKTKQLLDEYEDVEIYEALSGNATKLTEIRSRAEAIKQGG